jgi:glycosyl transferase, family 25
VNIRRLWQDRPGAAAYVLWPAGAEKLLARAPGLADAVISSAYNMRSFQADPALAIQIDQCEAHAIVPPIPVSSAILAVHRPSLDGLPALKRAAFRYRRILAQLRMGVRFAMHCLTSVNRKVALDRQ